MWTVAFVQVFKYRALMVLSIALSTQCSEIKDFDQMALTFDALSKLSGLMPFFFLYSFIGG